MPPRAMRDDASYDFTVRQKSWAQHPDAAKLKDVGRTDSRRKSICCDTAKQ